MNPDYPEGHIISKPKEIMASANEYRIYIKGRAAHVGLKNTGIDALNVATMFFQEMLKLMHCILKHVILTLFISVKCTVGMR